MRDPFAGYDQWKTASPYDDEVDPFEDADRFIEATNKYVDNPLGDEQELIIWARVLIEELRAIAEDA